MWVCLCNQFNEDNIRQGIQTLAKTLPETPDANELNQFYHDVYAWCGKQASGREGVSPQCGSCFDEFVDMVIKETLQKPIQPEKLIPFPVRVLTK